MEPVLFNVNVNIFQVQRTIIVQKILAEIFVLVDLIMEIQ